MSTPRHVSLRDARRMCKGLGADAVILISFHGDETAYASYGKDKAHCKLAGSLADQCFKAMGVEDQPPAEEPGS